PELASRPFDKDRDGFVIAGGAGVVVLEELEHAKARGAKIYAELTGYGATSDGYDMVAPSGEGGERAMRMALSTVPPERKVTYINAHGTSTPVGDVAEVEAIRRIFGEGKVPPISSTKSLTGHSLGATGVHEAIYSLLMMQGDFIAASANVFNLDPAIRPDEIATELREGVEHDTILSNSFGFGGTNATLAFSRYEG
ncbi:MAG: beta-ketoacyl-ACP synthase I, partial [Alphaproteobacteria bacterium]